MINPNRLDESEEGAAHGHLAAVGMAFLLGVALLRELRKRGRFVGGNPEPKIIDLLDLVALGHRRRRRPPEDAQPRLRHPGAEGHGGAREYRPRRARRRRPPGQKPELPRPGLRARPPDQCRRQGRQVRPRRPPAHLDRSRGSADHRHRARPPQRGTPRNRDAGQRSRRGRRRRPGRRAADPGCREAAGIPA